MPACPDLRALYADKYRISRDDAADSLADPWLHQIPGRLGTIYPFGDGLLAVDIDGHRAEGRWYVRELQHTADRIGGELLGIYDDVVTLDGDRWRFARRGFHLLYRGRLEMPGRVYRLPSRWPPSAAGSSEHS